MRVSCVDVVVTGSREDARRAPTPAFADWLEGRVPALLRFAYLVTGSQLAAEDAVQTALLRACERWSRVGVTRDPDAYVRRMVVNAHISAWRRTGRRETPLAEVRVTEPASAPGEQQAVADAVWRVCAGLPPRQRAAVVLRFYEDLSYAEVAELLGVAESTARSQVHRALAAMRHELEGDHDARG